MDSVGEQSSSPKDKSLSHLVTRFLELYNRDDVVLIEIDEAARRLGVEKGRIYGIVTHFDSIGLVGKRGKGQYAWKGCGAFYRVLSELKEEGIKEMFAADVNKEIDEGTKKTLIPDLNKPAMVIDEEEGDLNDHDDQENPISPKPGNKKENAQRKLARNVVKHFLCSDDDNIITIDVLAKALGINESEVQPTNMKSKVRPIYDVVNVFSSLNLIEKTSIPKSKTAAYRWIGPKPIADSLNSKKRASEVEVSSFNPKRNKKNCSYLEADASNEPSSSACTANEVLDIEPISIIYPPEFYNPGNGWIMRNQSLQMDLGRFEDALRSSQKDFGRK